MKLRLIIRLIFSKKFMLVTGVEKLNITSTYSSKEITKSGNAIYIHPIKK